MWKMRQSVTLPSWLFPFRSPRPDPLSCAVGSSALKAVDSEAVWPKLRAVGQIARQAVSLP